MKLKLWKTARFIAAVLAMAVLIIPFSLGKILTILSAWMRDASRLLIKLADKIADNPINAYFRNKVAAFEETQYR